MRRFEEVADGVLVMTSRRYCTTTTAVVGADQALVVDPAWDADELAGVAGVLADAHVVCGAGVATHVHYDHVLWHPTLTAVPRWATAWTVEQWQSHRDDLLRPLVGDLPSDLLHLAGRLQPFPGSTRVAANVPATPYPPATELPDPFVLPWSGREVIVHEHDAHARGHVALELPDAAVVIVGDMLSDIELPYPDPEDPDLVAYLVGLESLADVVGRAEVLIPGHGTPTTRPLARLDADRRYLDAVLAGNDPDDSRIANADMAALHQRTLQQARATSAATATTKTGRSLECHSHPMHPGIAGENGATRR
jgi:glyoxylase-like metal-dependent hydrolase (beta-lactamase superfamily II)